MIGDIEISGHVDSKGKFVAHDTELFKFVFDGFAGMDVVIIPRERKANKRSLNQNARYWVLITEATKAFNEQKTFQRVVDKEEIHWLFKGKYLGIKQWVTPQDGEIISMPKSTTKLTVSEMNDYMEYVESWCAEFLGITLPENKPHK